MNVNYVLSYLIMSYLKVKIKIYELTISFHTIQTSVNDKFLYQEP